MGRKRTLAVLLAVLLMIPFHLIGIGGSVQAANTNQMRYYYNQLGNEAKGIYDAMYAMYEKGIFKTGAQEYDLVGNNHITSEQLAAYGGKMDTVLSSFGAARDAFYADYPDVFYVDFSSLGISVSGNDVSGYKAFLGNYREGRNDYFVEGFRDAQQVESAVNEYNSTINEIAQGARNGSSSVREQVIYVNNAVIDRVEYRLDTNCSPGNSGHVRTAYGALVKHESLCEGYARAVKAVLDTLGIPCVLVQGYYRAPDGSNNLHMWNYVQIDGAWYGLDATANDGMKGSSQPDLYLLADSAVMGRNHTPDGVMSGAGFRFTYPQLSGGGSTGGDGAVEEEETDSEGYKTVFSQKDLLVKYKEDISGDEEVGIFRVSYKGMGYQEAVEKENVYILARFYQYMPGLGECVAGRWGYADPKPFVVTQPEHALVIPNSNSKYIQFAVTSVEPQGPLYGADLTAEELERNWNFQGTEADFLVVTDKLENPKGNFVPAPFARYVTPNNTGFIICGKKYSVKAVYNETLEEYNGLKAGYKLEVKDGWSAAANSKIENFNWDGDRTITFDFTPSEMLADNYAAYMINLTGLRGKESLKVPDSFRFDAKKKISICAYRPQGIYLNLGAKPELVEPSDLSYNGWVTDKGEKVTDLVGKLALVASKEELQPKLEATSPSLEQTNQMNSLIENKLGDKIVKSATYKLRLMTCNQNIIQTGNSVRLHIGFPEGYGPDEEGITYKAYHFKTDSKGNITGVEEINCITTQYGLMLTCNSFSPFAVAAVEEDKDSAKIKKVMVTNSEGGEVSIKEAKGDKIGKLSKEKLDGTNSEITVAIQAKDGYLLNKINLSGKGELKVTDEKSMELKVKYADVAGYDNILDVSFAPGEPKKDTVTGNTNQGSDPNKGPAAGSDDGKSTEKAKKSDKNNKSDKDKKKSEVSKPADQAKGGNASGDSSQNSASTGSGSGQGNDSASSKKADSDPVKAQETAPKEQAKVPVKEQNVTKQAKASPDTSLAASADESQPDADSGAGNEVSGQEMEAANEPEELVDVEDSQAPLGKGQDIADGGLTGSKSVLKEILFTLLVAVAASGIIVGALAGYVKWKKSRFE